MKKLIVVSVIFALVAGAAFAEATLGGQLMIGTTFLTNVDMDKDGIGTEDVMMGGLGFHEAKMSAVFGDSKGGGKLVFVGSNPDGSAYGMNLGNGGKKGNIWTWGFLYWRPITQFRMQVGLNADGDYGAAQISGWGFTGEAKNSVAAMSDYSYWGEQSYMLWIWQSALTRKGNAFYPGTGDLANVSFQFFPIDPLTLTLVLPIGSGMADSGDGAAGLAQNQLADFQFNAKYSIEEIGLLNISFVGKGGLGEDQEKEKSVGNLYASFYLTAISGMNMELGLVFGLPWEKEDGTEQDGYLGVGAGFRLDGGGPFTFKARVNARFAGKTDGADMPTLVYANILPCYKINNNLWAFLYTGLSMESFELYEGFRIGWFVNPYVWVRASEGLRFWAGLQIYQDGRRFEKFGATVEEDSKVCWRVPFGFNFYF